MSQTRASRPAPDSAPAPVPQPAARAATAPRTTPPRTTPPRAARPAQRTLWEEGREPGRQVVALGVALVLTAVVLDVAVVGRVSLFFDLCFVTVCIALALTVRPVDFFTVGVLPPLIMVAVFALLGFASPEVIADPHDGVVQAVVSGLSHHSGGLVVGYALCLVCLAVRHKVGAQAGDPQAANRSGSPAPRRTTSG